MADIEDNLAIVTYIQITRLYDVMMSIYAEMNPQKAAGLDEIHTKGDFLSSPPSVSVEGAPHENKS